MQLHRRAVMAAGAAVAVAPAAFAQTTKARPDPGPAIAAKAAEVRTKLDFDGTRFSGPAWDLLVREGREAQFFLIGEEHGIAENPKLAGQLFESFAPVGYRHLGIEISPPMARELDGAARRGPEALARLYRGGEGATAFFGMREESEMLARVRAAVPGAEPVLWGMDYEVGADRRLIALLEAAPKPVAAKAALARLRAASTASWAEYARTHDPTHIYGFAGDPDLVRAVRAAWPKPDARSAWVLDTLEETFEINRLWFAKKGWDSNLRRSRFMRANFLRHWKAELAAGRHPRAMFKMGANHLSRGLNSVGMYDLGTLIPEVAALNGGKTFSLMVLPGVQSQAAVFDPSAWTYRPGPAKDDYAEGLELLGGQAYPDAFTLFDLRPLRPLSQRAGMSAYPELVRAVNGFDALLVMSGSTPSHNL